jgi:hypothetical protein
LRQSTQQNRPQCSSDENSRSETARYFKARNIIGDAVE